MSGGCPGPAYAAPLSIAVARFAVDPNAWIVTSFAGSRPSRLSDSVAATYAEPPTLATPTTLPLRSAGVL